MKILMIIPADGWWALFEDKDGLCGTVVVCFALTDAGRVEPMCWGNGQVRPCIGLEGFTSIIHNDESIVEKPSQKPKS